MCYQLGFLTAHFPAFVTEMCNPILPTTAIYNLGITSASALGAISISLIGFEILRVPLALDTSAKHILEVPFIIHILCRTMVCTVFIYADHTNISCVVFTPDGLLWLATVPLTSGLIAQIYGLRYMGTLYGIVFFSHQLGGFIEYILEADYMMFMETIILSGG